MNEIKCKLFKVKSKINNFTFFRPSLGSNHLVQDKKVSVVKYRLDAYTYDNFPISWYYNSYRAHPLFPPELTIQEYDRITDYERSFVEEYINEFFSQEEARTLLTYLNGAENVTATMTEVKLPVENNCAPLTLGGIEPDMFIGDLPRVERPSQDIEPMPFSNFWSWPFLNYDLPFKVMYYFSFPNKCNEGAVLKNHIEKWLVTYIDELEEYEKLKREWTKEIEAELNQIQTPSQSIQPGGLDSPDSNILF